MKKILLSSVLLGLLVLPAVGLAQPPEEVPEDFDVIGALETLVNWLFSILLIVAALAIVVAGYYFVTAQGDPEKVKAARNFVLYALVGVAVAVAARGLVALVKELMGVG